MIVKHEGKEYNAKAYHKHPSGEMSVYLLDDDQKAVVIFSRNVYSKYGYWHSKDPKSYLCSVSKARELWSNHTQSEYRGNMEAYREDFEAQRKAEEEARERYQENLRRVKQEYMKGV